MDYNNDFRPYEPVRAGIMPHTKNRPFREEAAAWRLIPEESGVYFSTGFGSGVSGLRIRLRSYFLSGSFLSKAMRTITWSSWLPLFFVPKFVP